MNSEYSEYSEWMNGMWMNDTITNQFQSKSTHTLFIDIWNVIISNSLFSTNNNNLI